MGLYVYYVNQAKKEEEKLDNKNWDIICLFVLAI